MKIAIAISVFVLCLPIRTVAQKAERARSRVEAPETVWIWSTNCRGGEKLDATIRLDGKVLYRGFLPICRGQRTDEDGRVTFHFAGGHRFQGEYVTHPKDSIEGDIWQAGGEQDALILGISFDTGKKVLLNTLHVASPEKQTSSELDRGLLSRPIPYLLAEGPAEDTFRCRFRSPKWISLGTEQ